MPTCASISAQLTLLETSPNTVQYNTVQYSTEVLTRRHLVGTQNHGVEQIWHIEDNNSTISYAACSLEPKVSLNPKATLDSPIFLTLLCRAV